MRYLLAFSLPLLLGLTAEVAGPRALVKQASEAYSKETHGIIGCWVITESKIKSSVFNQEIYSESFLVAKDGHPVRSSLTRMRINGKEATAKQLEAQEKKTNESFRDEKNRIKQPFDPESLDEYKFSLDESYKPPAGATAIRFSSSIKDTQHGHGVIVIDSSDHIIDFTFAPNKYQAPATGGSFQIQRAEMGQGLFGMKHLYGEYFGSYGPIKGSMIFEQTCSKHQRFKSVEAAFN